MELPRNITQIGESDRRCKIYVEDYVISYLKQMNQVACDKDMAVALYGVCKEEDEVSYLFLYGACKLTFLQRETRHLSQAQQQEIETFRSRYFPEYCFLGYRLLNGEMIEGFHVCEQGICRYISGYAQFYEKNDSMLAYMLDAREEAPPEVVEQQKYEVVKKKQEERRAEYEEGNSQRTAPGGKPGSLRGMRVAVVAVFALLCVIGLTSMNGEGSLEDLQVMARQVLEEATQQKTSNAESEAKDGVHVNTLIAEDKLAEAIRKENEAAVAVEQVSAPEVATVPEEKTEPITNPELPTGEQTPETLIPAETVDEAATESGASGETDEAAEQEEAVSGGIISEEPKVVEETPEPVSYIIQEGDTLIGISVRNYGSDGWVSDICLLNQIKNPDEIKIGQKILLP